MEAGRAKRRLDSIFLFHAVASVVTGGLAFALPHHITEAILGQGHMVHAVIRLYGACHRKPLPGVGVLRR